MGYFLFANTPTNKISNKIYLRNFLENLCDNIISLICGVFMKKHKPTLALKEVILESCARLTDITGTIGTPKLKKNNPINIISDSKSLAQDWQNVGQDIFHSFQKFQKKHA